MLTIKGGLFVRTVQDAVRTAGASTYNLTLSDQSSHGLSWHGALQQHTPSSQVFVTATVQY